MKYLAIPGLLLALAACDTVSPATNESRFGLAEGQSLTVSQRAQIRSILANDEPTLSQRRRIRAILGR